MALKPWPVGLSPSASTVEVWDAGKVEVESEFSARKNVLRRSQPRWRGSITLPPVDETQDDEFRQRQHLEHLMAHLSGNPDDWTEIPIQRKGTPIKKDTTGTIAAISGDGEITLEETDAALGRAPSVGDYQRIADRLYQVSETAPVVGGKTPVKVTPVLDSGVRAGDAWKPGQTAAARIVGWNGGSTLTPDWYEALTLEWEEVVLPVNLGVNRFPQQLVVIEDRSVVLGSEISIGVGKVFSDPAGGTLGLFAVSAAPAHVRAVLTGTTLTLTGVRVGDAPITISAVEPGGLVSETTFIVSCVLPPETSDPPAILRNFARLTLFQGDDRHYTLSDYFGNRLEFADEGDPGAGLTFTVSSSDGSVARVEESGGDLTVTAEGVGECVITVMAEDQAGNRTRQDFDVAVFALGEVEEPDAPKLTAPIPDISIKVNEERRIRLGDHFGPLPLDFNHDSAALTNTHEANVSVTVSGSVLILRGLKVLAGASATVGVQGYQVSTGLKTQRDTFSVSITGTEAPVSCPVKVADLPDRTIRIGGIGAITIPLSGYFGHRAGASGEVSYAAPVADVPARVNLAIVNGVLSIRGLTAGTTNITVATNNAGCTAVSQTFTLTVQATAPPPPPPPPPPVIPPTRTLQARFSRINPGTHKAGTNPTVDLSRHLSVWDRTQVAGGRATNQPLSSGYAVAWSINANSNPAIAAIAGSIVTFTIPAASATRVYHINVGATITRTYTDQGDRNDQSVTVSAVIALRVEGAARPPDPEPQDRFGRSGNPARQTVVAGSPGFDVDLGDFYNPVNEPLTFTVSGNSDSAVATARGVSGGIHVTPGSKVGTTRLTVTPTDSDGVQGPTVTVEVETTPAQTRWPQPGIVNRPSSKSVRAGRSITFSVADTYSANTDDITVTVLGQNRRYISASIAGTTVTVRGVSAGVGRLIIWGRRSASGNRRASISTPVTVTVTVTSVPGGGGGGGNGPGDGV